MSELDFDQLLEINCFDRDASRRARAAELLEWRYCAEIRCGAMDRSVRFAHHARGCTVVAAKLSSGVVIFQNVTIGSNLRYSHLNERWENIGSPILAENVIIADGAKILGPIVIGANTVIGAGAIVTKDVPGNAVAYGVNHFKPRDPDHDLVFGSAMISGEQIMAVDRQRVERFNAATTR